MKFRIFLSAIVVIAAQQLYACSCIGQASIKDAIKSSDAVFEGTVIDQEYIVVIDSLAPVIAGDTSQNFMYQRTIVAYTFVIEKKYKGKVLNDTVNILTGTGGGDCGFAFEVGKKYIVYTTETTYTGNDYIDRDYPKGKDVFWTNICTRTTQFSTEEQSGIQQYRRGKSIKN